ncbi:MAG: U32 family peptidase [Lachnospiraceae bacterium]|nr:U32 family peptidase [Lachnospiraceae bacterium]
MKKKVELLAPAGNYEAFAGALNAGADAVYLGGEKFGARAYADNFSTEEICRALRYGHILGKKIYLTVNTLVKEQEFASLYDYLCPFYEAGLDGVIIQDLGVWQYIRETFPGMALHASTQMTITGSQGALLLKEMGAARIVPARELSLVEIKAIKEETGLELECFIHGAMCYSYSGQCLFSSILGGRSGNRGRCAQPCRLPYQISDPDGQLKGDAGYVLSLKDMCALAFLPKLIEAGIDSFKIEGRMKRPEYAAGVTAVYRKYIDAYYETPDDHRVEPSDMDRLRNLYIRDEVQTGYYERTNGREMVTIKKPGYLKTEEALLSEIAETYLGREQKCPVSLYASFCAGKKAVLRIEGGGVSVTVWGPVVEQAQKRPMTKEDLLKQLCRTGNTFVEITNTEVVTGGNVFMPVSRLNELRRNAIEAFEDRLIEEKGGLSRRTPVQDTLQNGQKKPQNCDIQAQLHVAVQNLEQLKTVLRYPCERIYIDSDWYLEEFDQISQCVNKTSKSAIFLALPYVVRKKDDSYFQEVFSCLAGNLKIDGFLVRNLESLFRIHAFAPEYEIVTDAGVYCFNAKAGQFLHQYCKESYLPYELNGKECRRLAGEMAAQSEAGKSGEPHRMSIVVYGTIPMMVSANCVRKTASACPGTADSRRGRETCYLTDRYHVRFPVLCNCRHCYNVLYNSVPYSLHQKREELSRMQLYAERLDFIWETGKQVEKIMDHYFGKEDEFPLGEYTTGHYKRGVE